MISVNLLPESVQAAQFRRQRIARWGLSVAVAVGILTVPLGFEWFQRAKAAELRTANEQLQSQLTTIRTELRALTSHVSQTRQQLERADALRSKRAWSAMLGMIARRMPSGCWLTSIATIPAAPARSARRTGSAPGNPTGSESPSAVVIDAPRQLRLSGYAADAAEPHVFVAGLKDTGVFASVVLQRSTREAVFDGNCFRFELVCEW